MITVLPDEKVLMIDFSYYFIYRYYAIMSWFKISQTPFDEEVLLTKYKKVFIDNIEKIIKKFKVNKKNVILVGDCSRKNIWRLDIFDKYKENRDKIDDKEQQINPKIFPIIYDEIVPLLKEKGIQYVCHEKLEADDIVYIISKKIPNEIVILTNDNDYLQMIRDNLDVVNLPSFKSIRNRCLSNPRKDLLLKVLSGDPSDNIPSIVGKKQALKMINTDDEDVIHKYIEQNDLRRQFAMNMMLIDMSQIPREFFYDIVIETQNHS